MPPARPSPRSRSVPGRLRRRLSRLHRTARKATWHWAITNEEFPWTSPARWSSTGRHCALRPAMPPFSGGRRSAEQGLGRWDAAVEHLREAVRLDPRSANNLRILGDALLRLRRYPEAREAFDRALALAPASLNLIEGKAMTFLGEGDLAGARAVLVPRPGTSSPPRWWPSWRTTGISSGSSTTSSESCCCG